MDEKVKKNEVQKKCTFCARSFWRLLDVQYYCGILFWYNYWCPESLEYVQPLHSHYGRTLFQKVSKILPKNCSWGTLSETKCCPWRVQQKELFSETNFICMNIIRLQGLDAGTVPCRNNGLLSWSMEFGVRPKTEFSKISFFFQKSSPFESFKNVLLILVIRIGKRIGIIFF